MSIENLLTLGLAAAILVAAALLRLLVLGAVRLYCKLSGHQIPWQRTASDVAVVRDRDRGTERPALNALTGLGGGLVYVLATLGTWMRSAGSVVAHATSAAYAFMSPRVSSGARKGLLAAGRKIRSAAIVTVASGQHLSRVAKDRVRDMSDERAASAPVDEPSEARVILLDRDWDPLTDPLEDQPASNAR